MSCNRFYLQSFLQDLQLRWQQFQLYALQRWKRGMQRRDAKKRNNVKSKTDDKKMYRIIWQQLGLRIARLEIKSNQ